MATGSGDVYFNAKLAKVQYGYLLIWRVGVRRQAWPHPGQSWCLSTVCFLQLGKGYYTGMAANLGL